VTRGKGEPVRNVAASVKARLLALAREGNTDFNYLLTRYVHERLLYRLSLSRHRETFLLKGAMLFAVWSEHPHRPTKDIDLLGQGAPDTDRLIRVFGDVCGQPTEHDDGVEFLTETIQAEPIREDAVYDGIRVTFMGKLGTARIPVQVDVGFGDATPPVPDSIDVPTLLDFPRPKLNCYSRETVVAEKLHAMVDLGMANSRMKDFFDVWFLSQQYGFEGSTLAAAVTATFGRRRTAIPIGPPLGLTETFSRDPTKLQQWGAFLKRTRTVASPALPDAIRAISEFLRPVLGQRAHSGGFVATWQPGGPWRSA